MNGLTYSITMVGSSNPKAKIRARGIMWAKTCPPFFIEILLNQKQTKSLKFHTTTLSLHLFILGRRDSLLVILENPFSPFIQTLPK